MGYFYLKEGVGTKNLYHRTVRTKQGSLKQSLELLHFVFNEIVYNISVPLWWTLQKMYPDEKWAQSFNFTTLPLQSYNVLLKLTNDVYAARIEGRFREFCFEVARTYIATIFENVMSQNTLNSSPEKTSGLSWNSIDDAQLSYYTDLIEDAIKFKWHQLLMARGYVLYIQRSQKMLYKPKRHNQL